MALKYLASKTDVEQTTLEQFFLETKTLRLASGHERKAELYLKIA